MLSIIFLRQKAKQVQVNEMAQIGTAQIHQQAQHVESR